MIEVYTDGACSGAPGPGGWAWIVEDSSRWATGNDPSTTNQRMEMRAVLEACLTVVEHDIRIVSDSAYVVNCFKDRWYLGWDLASGRKIKDGKRLANVDLWEPLIDIVLHRGVTFRKVRGHSGEVMNEVVDKLCVAAKKEIM